MFEYYSTIVNLLATGREEWKQYFATEYLLAARKVETDVATWNSAAPNSSPQEPPMTTLPPEISSHPQARFLPWPHDARYNLSSLTCETVSVQEIDKLFGRTNELTFFTSAQEVFAVGFRPLLPGEHTCEGNDQ
jgi:hypothetical protein